MAPYTYNNYYDPVGSQSNQAQPQGYTYANQQNQSSGNTQYGNQNTSYQAGYNQSYGNTYGNQPYGTSGQQQTSANTSNAASALSSLSNQDYTQSSSGGNRSNNSNVTAQYDNSTWGNQNYSSSTGYNSLTNRSQANNSPLYATQNSGSSTFGRLSLPDQSQSSPNTFSNAQNYQTASSNASTKTYQNAPSSAGFKTAYQSQQTQQQNQPQRYNSPLHAVQAQQSGHHKQSSRASNHAQSPQMPPQSAPHLGHNQRQQSASVEPSPTTVDPSQVYDFRAEQEKRARIEAERRKQMEAEAAVKKAEEDARKAEEEARKAEEERVATELREREEGIRIAKEAEDKKKAAQVKKNEQRKKAREEKKQSKTAATALQQMAASGSAADMMAAMMGGDSSGAPANDEEAEMRAMFKKMREFNQKNPAMLAKLWEEERKQHAATQDSPQPQTTAQPTVAAPPPAQPIVAAPPPPKQKKQNNPAAFASTPTVGQAIAQQAQRPAALASKTPAQASPTAQGVGSLWPPHKKGSLAEAAAKWLGELPFNKNNGITISKENILKILDTNPSYVQLCESVEKTGMRFERSALAKELLKAVPDGLRNQPSKNGTPANNIVANQVNGAAASPADPPKKRGRPKKDGPTTYSVPNNGRQSTGTVSYAAPSFTSLTDAAREVNAMGTASSFPSTVSASIQSTLGGPVQPALAQDASFFDSGPVMIDDDPPGPVQPEVKPEDPRQEPLPPPKDKEEAARKRGFGDLVDLTQEDSDEDEGPPKKVFIPSVGPPNGVTPIVPSNAPSFSKPVSFQQFMSNNMQSSRQSLTPGQGGMHHPSGPPRPAWQPSATPSWMQQNKPQSPAAPPPSQLRTKGPTEEQKQHERMRGKMLVEPIMRDRVARKSKYDSRTIARDVLLATGRHPDMRPLNMHLNGMQKLLGDHGGVIDGAGNKSDLATIRWDIIDPGEPTAEAKAKLRKKTPAKDGDVKEGDEADDESEGGFRYDREISAKPIPSLPKRRRRKRDPITKELLPLSDREDDTGRDDSDAPEQLRRQAPEPNFSRGTARGPRTSEVRDASNTDNNSSPQPNRGTTVRRGSIASNRPGGSPASMSASGKAVGYAAFQQFDEQGNPIKKKGRPVGWRKSIHSREAQGLTPKKTGSYEPKGARTSSHLRQSAAEKKFVEPQYQVYHCKWRGCTAELDNLEKLKKHALKFHGVANDEGDFECLWKNCRSHGLHVDANGKTRFGDDGVASFDTIEHWLKHVNKAHFEEIAQTLGDGPRGGSVSDVQTDSDAYLSDAYGRSVTPIIVPLSERQQQGGEEEQTKPEGTMSPPAVKRGPGRLTQHGESVFLTGLTGLSKEEQYAAAELKKLEDQKRREGPTMGLESSRLVNEKRRKGFLDDEDFMDVIDDTEPEV